MPDDAKRKRGRPLVAEPRNHSITVWFTSKEYQAVYRESKRNELPMSSAVRERALRRAGNKPTE